MMRASELSPASHLLFGEVLAEAGFPERVVDVVTNAPADGAEVIQSPVAGAG